jgi:tRNA A37 threonylcarbamoyladenosine biosynthesis protein TsaE
MSAQLWQSMKLASTDAMVGNTDALPNLKSTRNGMILLHGPMGTGKTSLALAADAVGYIYISNSMGIQRPCFIVIPGWETLGIVRYQMVTRS